MLGDLNISEPNALIGFAGPCVVKETIGKDLPAGFQRAEFVLEHGFLDAIVPRAELKGEAGICLENAPHSGVNEGGSVFRLIFALHFYTSRTSIDFAHVLDSEKKKEFFAKHGKGATDTGSPEGQIAMFSFRIAHLTEHLKQNRKKTSTPSAP